MFAEPFLHAAHGVALEFEFVFQALVPDALLAHRAGFPTLLRTLVAADVDILRGKQLQDLRENVLQESERCFLARAVDFGADAPARADLITLAPAAQPWIGRQRRHGVSRQFDLGDHRDKAVCGVFHDITNLFLRVESPVGCSVVFGRIGVMAHERLPPNRPDPRQLGVFFDLDAPALILGEVPVEAVHLVQGEDVDEFFDLVRGPEIAAGVEHASAVFEERTVFHRHDGQDAVAVHDELAQALQAVEHALRRAAADCDARRRDFEHIRFGGQRIVCCQADGTSGGAFHAASEHRFDGFGKKFGNAPQPGVPARADHGRGG